MHMGWRRSQYLQGTLLYPLLQSAPKFPLKHQPKIGSILIITFLDWYCPDKCSLQSPAAARLRQQSLHGPHHSQQHPVTQDELLSSGMQRTPELPRETDRLCLDEPQETEELHPRATT